MANDADGIRAVVDKFNTTVTADDPDTWIDVFTDDALMLPADLPIVSGKDAIEKWGVDSWFTPFNMKLNQVIDELDIAGHIDLPGPVREGPWQVGLAGAAHESGVGEHHVGVLGLGEPAWAVGGEG